MDREGYDVGLELGWGETAVTPKIKLVATPISPERRDRLVALANLHQTWARGAVKTAAFDPDAAGHGADYGQHNADVDATAAREDSFQKAARKIMGLDPVTGARITE